VDRAIAKPFISHDLPVDVGNNAGVALVETLEKHRCLIAKMRQPGVKGPSALARIANRYNATPAQVALAWLLRRSPVMLPIPGTARRQHLEENVAAATVELSAEDFVKLC
jgi:aryl-alcohol dehydrogenase-like predicted oxidoreductase